MTSVRSCGCTYRDTGSAPIPQGDYDKMKARVAKFLDAYGDEGVRWSDLCNATDSHTYETRDELHRILHTMAIPEVTPQQGRGRRGTRWHLTNG